MKDRLSAVWADEPPTLGEREWEMNDKTSAEGVPAVADGGSSLAEQIFAGKGEMAALIRATDWSKTPFGSIESWPQSLRTAVSICLGSRHPIVLWWGPERWMFYNDGYRPMLGESKHPQFLGQPGQACWAEIWHIIGPMMDQVIETGEATWSEDLFLLMLRHGYLEETYFTFSYSPIRDDTGRPSGIFNACTESTRRVLGERRMKTLREMAVEARTVNEAARLCAEILGRNARDMPFALVYLLDNAGERLRLAGYAGLAPGTEASPVIVEMVNGADAGWPLARVAAQGRSETVEDLADRFDCLPKEPWEEPAHQAMILPIARPGSPQPAGVLVLGISPRRAFDDDYRGFFDLVAGHVATAVSNARAYEEERERAERLAELDRVKTTFFSNVSHEFRTPLTLILGPLEDALRDPARSLRGDSLEAVHRSALRLLKLVNTLLDFSRIEAGRLQARFEPTDLSMLTAGLAGSFQSLVESAGLKLVVHCPPLPEPIYVDRAHWEKIVLNLISNAFKFAFEGEIAVLLLIHEDHVELSVHDTGTGIPAEEQARIFERFDRIEGARGRSFEGTGIGLALVQELTNQHGGSLRVDSVHGKGSTFVVSIPRGSDHLAKDRIFSESTNAPHVNGTATYLLEAAHWVARDTTDSLGLVSVDDAQPAAADTLSTPNHGARVLVADDNADMREYLLRLLSPKWTVDAVGDGQAALESALQRTPDLVLSDVMMPRMDGIALLRALRADPRTSTVPFMLLSARAGEEAVVGGLETGADDYLVKPFSARELLSRVNSHLEMARVRRAAADAARELAETRAALLEDLERKNQELLRSREALRLEVAARARAEEELRRSNTELENAIVAKDHFLASMSHELRTPMNGIIGFTGTLLMKLPGPLTHEQEKQLNIVQTSARHLLALISDLLDIAKITSGKVEFKPEAVACHDVIDEVIGSMRPLATDKGLKLNTNLREVAIIARTDRRTLTQILLNLLGNAVKFTDKGSVSVKVGARQENGARLIEFSVADTGPGIRPVEQAKLFGAFVRLGTTAARGPDGTGLGLHLSQKLANSLGGQIICHSEYGQGSTFKLIIPENRGGM
jgi:signal transduction histidine kinase